MSILGVTCAFQTERSNNTLNSCMAIQVFLKFLKRYCPFYNTRYCTQN